MKNILNLLFCTLLFTACKNSADPALPANLSANENNGLQEIIKTYGGEIHFNKGNMASGNETKRVFEISISNSFKMEDKAKDAKLISSGLAWLMYKNMGADTKNYDEIHSILTMKDGNKTTTKYPIKDLKVVAEKNEVLNKMVAIIKAKKYEELKPFLNNTDLVKYPKDEIIGELNLLDKTSGDVKGFTLFGFKRNKAADGRSILQLSGFLNREKKDQAISVAADMQSDKEEVLFLQFML